MIWKVLYWLAVVAILLVIGMTSFIVAIIVVAATREIIDRWTK